LFSPDLLRVPSPQDEKLHKILVSKIFSNLYSTKQSAREIAVKLIERIAAKARITVV
jgi:hypothetical protein